MSQSVVILALFVVKLVTTAPSPVQVTIDCSSEENRSLLKAKSGELLTDNSSVERNSFCGLIHNSIPKAVKDGKFIIDEFNLQTDQFSASNTPVNRAVAPPSGDISKIFSKPKLPRIKTPTLNIPKLKSHGTSRAPKLGAPMRYLSLKKVLEEESSAERMERFKNGVQKLLHVVKVLGQIDQYLSERTRIVIDKLSKTFME